MKFKILIISLFVVSMFLLTACSNKTVDENKLNDTDKNASENAQIANPASTFCIENGGVLEIRNEVVEGSQTGYCKIAGKECEEWALFRGECAQVHVCTPEEKAAEMCTLEYMPVCGNDGKTYGNKCSACSSKVTYWVDGECTNTA